MDGFTTHFITKEELPLVIEPVNKQIKLEETLQLIRQNSEHFKTKLLKYGGILFRNFPISNEDDFSALISAMGTGRFVDYIGGDSPRNKVKGGVYTSTELPPSLKIPLHNELSFVKKYPKHIYFYCHIAPQVRGETTIADARKIYNAIDPEVKKRFTEKGLRYVSCYFKNSLLFNLLNKYQKSHKSWLDVFETDKKEDVERKCREHDFEYEWNKNDWLRITQRRPGVMAHPKTNEMVWFNQVHLYDFNPRLTGGTFRYLAAKALYCRKHTRLHEIYFGDNSKISRKDLYHIMDVLEAHSIYFPWQKGDVLMLDNVLSMHGRNTFEGPRRILTALTD
jgi:alpha-ketoglutarate-dependent taurine dioxygenase